MVDYDSYFTNNDKPFAETINDALLLSNMFDLNVDIILPEVYSNQTWSVSTGNRKAGVAITNVKEATGLSVTTVDDKSAITGTGTLKLGFYPNFNAFGGIDKITWTGTGTITCSIYSSSGSLITSVTNGETISSTPSLSTLQNFEIRLTLTNATLQTVKVGMTNKEHTRYGAKISQEEVIGLNDKLAETTVASATIHEPTTFYGTSSIMIRNGYATVYFQINTIGSGTSLYIPLTLLDLPSEFTPKFDVESTAKIYNTGGAERIASIRVRVIDDLPRVQLWASEFITGQSIVGTIVYPVATY